MYERREEAWRPLNKDRVAAFLRLFLLCFVELENGLPLHPFTYRMMKKLPCEKNHPLDSFSVSVHQGGEVVAD